MAKVPKDMLDAALSYAGRGWPVLPVHTPHNANCSCGKVDCHRPGKHPRTPHGLKDATTDQDTIRRWWARWPDANIGILTGQESGLAVIDLDLRGEINGVATAKSQFDFEPQSHFQRTGGGGVQAFFRRPDLLAVRNRTGGSAIAPGVELKADGGYVIVPPSLHRSGHRYRWLSDPKTGGELPDLPAWALNGSGRGVPASGAKADGGAIREGARSNTLASFAGSMRNRGMSPAAIEAALTEENTARCSPPLPKVEVRKIAKSISRYPIGPTRRGADTTAALATDIGNAARLVQRHGADLRYCAAWGKWLAWDGARWCPDADLQVMRHAKETALSIYNEAKEADGERQEKLSKWALMSQRRERLSAMVDLAHCELPVSPTGLDADPWSLNVLNGTIDLRTGKLREHRHGDLITKLAPVQFDPAATCPLWDSFLLRIMDGDAAMIRYLQRIAGLCLTGDIREQCLFIFYGTGANGKSVFLDTLTGMLGDYAGEAAPDLLVVRRSEEHPCEVADLCGRRLVVASETEEGIRLKVQLIKRLTGNARLKARFMRQDYFEFSRTHKLILATNNKPVVREGTHAISRRLRLIPFNVTIPEREQDKELTRKLTAEWPGVLAWAVAGCLAWQRDGLSPPEAVNAATQAYLNEQDLLRDFLESCCTLTADAWTERTELFKAYRWWADSAGERAPLERTQFYERLRGRPGIEDEQRRVKSRPQRGFRGIGLLAGEGVAGRSR